VQFIANITVGSLNKNEQCSQHLLAVDKFGKTNSSLVTEFFIDFINLLWPNGIQHERLLLFVTHAASYMIKANTAFKGILVFPNMTHLTCLTHGLQRVAENSCKFFPC
jgi:hypothetical protein